MLVGDPTRRRDHGDSDSRMLSFRCWDKDFAAMPGAPGQGSDTKSFPAKPCPGGIRANHFFPTSVKVALLLFPTGC